MNESIENEEHQAIKIRCADATGSALAFREITPASDLGELQKIAHDYEWGKSYCTASMRFEDYKQISKWIEEKERRPGQPQFPLTESDFLELLEFRADPVQLESDKLLFEESCREFEEGELVVIFPDGLRKRTAFTKILSKGTPLAELKESAWRASAENDGETRLAALPQEKEELLKTWIIDKEKRLEEMEADKQFFLEHENLHWVHSMLQEKTILKGYSKNSYAQARDEEIDESIRQLFLLNSELTDTVRDHLVFEQDWLDAKFAAFENIARRLPQLAPELPVIPQMPPAPEMPAEGSDNSQHSINTISTEGLIVLRSKAKSGQCKLPKEELEILDKLILEKRKESNKLSRDFAPEKNRKRDKTKNKKDTPEL